MPVVNQSTLGHYPEGNYSHQILKESWITTKHPQWNTVNIFTNTSANQSQYVRLNGSDSGSAPFFSHYFARERFIAECVLAGAAIFINTLAFLLSRQQHHQHYAYYALFKHLTFANALSSLLNWLSNNILIIFQSVLVEVNLCVLMSAMTIALLATVLLDLISTVMLLGFSFVHYIAVCHPLSYPVHVNRRSVNCGLLIVWCTLPALFLIPLLILMARVLPSCHLHQVIFIEFLSRICININIGLLQLIILLIFVFCIRIHMEIRLLQSRLSDYCWVDEMQLEKRTFRSILFLVCTLAVFFLPFTIMFVVSYNQGNADMINTRAVVFIMTLMPYIKFCTDPILYKKTALGDINVGFKLFLHICYCCCCCKDVKGRRNSLITTRLTRLSSKRENRARILTVL